MPRGRRRRQEIQSSDSSHGRNIQSQLRRGDSTTDRDRDHPLRRSSRLSNRAGPVSVPAASPSASVSIEPTSEINDSIDTQGLYPSIVHNTLNPASHFGETRGNTILNGSESRQNTFAPAQAVTGDSSNDLAMYNLILTTQPPSTVRIGHPMYPACSVQVRLGYGYLDTYEDISHLVAIATFVPAGNGNPVDDGTSRPIIGPLVESIHSISESDEQNDDQVVGLASFSGVTIQQPGDYQIRVTLVRVGEQAVNLQAVYSEVISVS